MPNTYVFISGPYQAEGGGHDPTHYYEIDKHINEARLWAMRLAEANIPFFCPHMNSAHVETLVPDVSVDYWLDLDMRILEHASVLLLIPDWVRSKGAQAERQRADDLGILIYTYHEFDDLVEFWTSGVILRPSVVVSKKEGVHAIY